MRPTCPTFPTAFNLQINLLFYSRSLKNGRKSRKSRISRKSLRESAKTTVLLFVLLFATVLLFDVISPLFNKVFYRIRVRFLVDNTLNQCLLTSVIDHKVGRGVAHQHLSTARNPKDI